MAITNPVLATPAAFESSTPPRSVQWGAVILGALGATAISMVLLTFGAGIGLSATSAQPYAGASAKAIAIISGLYTAVVLVASFGLGGYVTGRMRSLSAPEDIAESDFRDGAHGFAVWALAIVLGGLVAASSVGGAIKLAVQTTTAAGVATAAGAASNPDVTSRLSMTPTDYAMDRLMAPSPAASAPAAANTGIPAPAPAMSATPTPTPSSSRADLNAPMGRIFASTLKSGQLDARDRTTLTSMVMQQTGLPQADAEKRVDESYADLKTAEQKARDAAEKVRKAALITAFAAAATLLLGCAAACAAATAGAHHRRESTAIAFFGTRRFW